MWRMQLLQQPQRSSPPARKAHADQQLIGSNETRYPTSDG